MSVGPFPDSTIATVVVPFGSEVMKMVTPATALAGRTSSPATRGNNNRRLLRMGSPMIG